MGRLPGTESGAVGSPSVLALVAALGLAFLVASASGTQADAGTGSLRSASAAPTWVNVTDPAAARPPLDFWASMAFDPIGRDLVLFGGCNLVACPAPAQTWTLANGTWANVTSRGPQPPSRSYAPIAYDSADGYALMYGGTGATAVLGDTWTYAAGRWTNRTSPAGGGVAPRWGEGLAYDPIARGVLMFGGESSSGALLNETWLFSGGTWHNLTRPASPPARFEASMSWDVTDGELVLFGGCGVTACPLNDTWIFANGNWSREPVSSGTSPAPRELASMTYDAVAGVVRMFGGIGGGVSLGDTWTFAGGRWSPVATATAPRAREGSASPESTEAWLGNGTRTAWPYEALWGGDYVRCPTCPLEGLEDTWVFESPPAVSVSGQPSNAVTGQAVLLEGTATGGTAPLAFRWDLGDGSVGYGANVTHAFSSPGVYTVGLVVRDGAGALASATTTVTVTTDLSIFLAVGAAGAVAVIAAAYLGLRRRRRRPPEAIERPGP